MRFGRCVAISRFLFVVITMTSATAGYVIADDGNVTSSLLRFMKPALESNETRQARRSRDNLLPLRHVGLSVDVLRRFVNDSFAAHAAAVEDDVTKRSAILRRIDDAATDGDWKPQNETESSDENEDADDEIVDVLGPASSTAFDRRGLLPRPEGQRRLPHVIIIGVKKGGTRALLEFLRAHPDVRAVGPEVHFFDKNYHRGLDWYRRMMPMTSTGQLTVEKTPSYFVTRGVPERIRQMSVDVRLIVVLRDPVTRALSDYAQAVTKRPHLPPFERLAFVGNSTRVVNASWKAIQIGLYAAHVRRWMESFPLRRIHFVSGERLVADPAAVVADVQDFIGVRRAVTADHFRFSPSKGFPCLVRDGRVRCLGKTKGREHPVVKPEVFDALREFFRPHNDDLRRLTGIDFRWP